MALSFMKFTAGLMTTERERDSSMFVLVTRRAAWSEYQYPSSPPSPPSPPPHYNSLQLFPSHGSADLQERRKVVGADCLTALLYISDKISN